MYNSTLSSISEINGGGWLTPRVDCFTPGKQTRYPLYRKLGGRQGRSGRTRNTSPPRGLDSRTVQSVASRYTDYAILAHRRIIQGGSNMTGTNCELFTHNQYSILTPWSRVLPELLKKFPAFYGTRRFITAFTRARHLSLS
jgi:hypothetical protein